MKKKAILQSAIFLCAMILMWHGEYAYSDNAGKMPSAINLVDRDQKHPVLRELHADGFFNFHGITPRQLSGDNKTILVPGTITLTADTKTIREESFYSFNLLAYDSLNQSISMNWDVPIDNSHMQSVSLQAMISLANQGRETYLANAFIDTPGVTDRITDISVSYRDDGPETVVSGYEFTCNSGISPTHRFFRTLGELMLMNGIGVANYWINRDANMEDWRYKYRWEDVGPRFLDGWSLDTNAYRTNTLYHLYSGAIYYQIARSNDYGVIASTVWSFFGSFFWEYAGEWREQTSGNDMFITPFGGAITGEALRQTSIYIERCLPHSVYGTIVAFLLDPMRIVNRKLDRWMDGSFKVNIVISNPAQSIIEKAMPDRDRR
jgi:hypothetical protein